MALKLLGSYGRGVFCLSSVSLAQGYGTSASPSSASPSSRAVAQLAERVAQLAEQQRRQHVGLGGASAAPSSKCLGMVGAEQEKCLKDEGITSGSSAGGTSSSGTSSSSLWLQQQ